jgi:hypothetical protein
MDNQRKGIAPPSPQNEDSEGMPGTRNHLIDVTEELEPVIGIPILGINAVTFWYALRENGGRKRCGRRWLRDLRERRAAVKTA